MTLIGSPNFPDPDGLYAELLDLYRGLDQREIESMNPRLILLLANHIGDREILREAFEAAKRDIGR